MKLLVLSDSHGNADNMIQAVEQVQPDMILYLGDGVRDAEKLGTFFPNLPLERVCGNCDLASIDPPERILCIEDKRIMMCHGHTLGVKSSLLTAMYAALEQKADLFLFGHTHRPFCETRNGVAMLNPGSIGDGRYPTYGIVEIKNSAITMTTEPLFGYPHAK